MLKQKIVPIILAILMLLSLLAGCQSMGISNTAPSHTSSIPTTVKPTTMPTTAPQPTRYDPLAIPPDITESLISYFYQKAGITKSRYTNLYILGVFDDSYAVLIRDITNPGEPCWETVNGLTFYYADGYPILWHYKGQSKSTTGHLSQLFENQLITEEQLQVIYTNYYRPFQELLYLAERQCDFGPEEKEAVIQALLQLTGEDLSWDSVNSIGRQRLVYYCSMMGMHVIRWIPEMHTGLLTMKYLNVGSYSFAHMEFMQLYVYVGEELLTLAEVYERGIFTDAQLEIIYRFHVTSSAH